MIKEKNYDAMRAYQQSKLANVMHSLTLARRLEGKGVSAYSLTPGNVATEITRNVTDKPGFKCMPFFDAISMVHGITVFRKIKSGPSLLGLESNQRH